MSKQSRVLDELVMKLYRGQLTRRAFLLHAIRMGVSISGALALLSSCAESPPPPCTTNLTGSLGTTGKINIIWESEKDYGNTYQSLVDAYNKTNKENVHVTYLNQPGGNQQYDRVTGKLRVREGTPDVISMDVIWVEEFASKGWVVPLCDLWSKDDQKPYIGTAIMAATSQGHIWAAPFRLDVGLLYYRTDMKPQSPVTWPPKTWNDLTRGTRQVQHNNGLSYGYLWQGKQFEGLVCNFLEVLSGYDGSILDLRDTTKVVVDGPPARNALNTMRGWIGTISPSKVTSQDEGNSAGFWKEGQVALMRNWPTFISQSNSSKAIALKYDVATFPHTQPGKTGLSCIGGWVLGINAYSSNQKAAWDFIQWMIQEDAQLFAAINGSYTVARGDVYGNQYIREQNPLYQELLSIIEDHAQLRPPHPDYQNISKNIIQPLLFQALTDRSQTAINDALTALQKKLQPYFSRKR